jgi:predicted GNAT family acetyltransferase
MPDSTQNPQSAQDPERPDRPVVTDNADRRRYEARITGQLAGFADYRVTDQTVVFTHTEVQPEFEGRGVGSALVRQALDDVRRDGTHRVQVLCPFVQGWIDRHPDYTDLLADPPARD